MNAKLDRALPRYVELLRGATAPRFRSADLQSRVNDAMKILTDCHLCERGCRINRTQGEKGYCKTGNALSVSSCFDHYGEEPFLVPSFTIFFNSCTFSCSFCQNWEISHIDEVPASHATTKQLARVIDQHGYCRNVNFVGGEPTPYLPFILGTLAHVNVNVPVVWNSNFYMSEQSMGLLRGIVDIYLTDFKYGNDRCAERLSDVPRYREVVTRNHRLAFDDAEVVIRHLIMPNHMECCTKPVLRFIAEEFGDRVVVNLMDQYRPCYRAREFPDISRRLTVDEFASAVTYAKNLKLNFIT